jgi:hypothetical protein
VNETYKVKMNSNKLKIWTIFFYNEISPEEISAFRGAIIANSGSESLLFHNHDTDERFRYRYPLIQYKRIHRKAAIICVGVGLSAFSLLQISTTIRIKTRGG